MLDLPPRARHFREAAACLGLTVDIVVTAAPARTAAEAAAAVGCGVDQIVKSLVFRGSASGRAALFLVAGGNRLDEARAADALGEGLTRPDAGFVRAATGYAIGGIPPFGHIAILPTFMDRTLLGFPLVWAAAGTPNTVFEIDPDRLRAITAAVLMA